MYIAYCSFKKQTLLNRISILLTLRLHFLLFFALLPSVLFTQSSYIRFNRITINQGLSLSSVYCIYQDSQGFMWFGTEDGLNRYDGKNFRIFRTVTGDTNCISYKWTEIIFEDQSGSLWFGSRGGLTRYDPAKEQFTQYKMDAGRPEGLVNDTVTVIAEDNNNQLWIGTYGGLNRIQGKTGAIERIPMPTGGSQVNALLFDEKGNLWIGSHSGLFYRDGKTSAISKIRLSENPEEKIAVYSLKLHKKNLWIGSDRGLGKLSPTDKVPEFQSIGSLMGHNHPDQTVEKILFDESGNSWIGASEGLYRYNLSDPHFTLIVEARDASNSLSINTSKSIHLDSSGILWYGTHGSGLYTINTSNELVSFFRNNPADPKSISENSINCIFQDRTGALWVGTFGAGISILDPEANKFQLLTNNPMEPGSLSSNFIWSVFEAEDGTVWIGTNDRGLNCYFPETGAFTFYDHRDNDPFSLAASSVRKVYQDSKGRIWIGTDGGGLDLFDRETGRFKHFRHDPENPSTISHNSVRTMYEDDAGKLWIGTRQGLNKFDPATGQFKRYVHSPDDPESISHNFVYAAILKDSRGNLWVGTYGGGLNKMNLENESFTRYQNDPEDPASLSDNIVFTIYEDHRGRIWVGTNNGLNLMDQATERFIRFGVAQGLPNEVVYGILPDDQNNIWMSTNFGIARLNLTDFSVTNFDVSDGLQSNEFNGGAFHRGKCGKHYWGGVYGLNIIDPEKIKPAKNRSNVVITKLEILGKEVGVKNMGLSGQNTEESNKIVVEGANLYTTKNISYTSEIVLNYAQRFISFEFNALNKPSSQRMNYFYRMENMENDWNYSGDRNFVTYANMQPGTYVFKVNATNKDGIASPNPAELIVTIDPPFWKTWWFILIEVAAVVALIVFVYIYLLNTRTNKLLTAQNQQIFASNQKLQESQQQLRELNATKDKFFSIIAHDLKNPFTSLLSISEMMSKNYNALDEEDKISGIDGFHRSAQRIYALLENLLTWSRSQTGRVNFNPVAFNISKLAMDCIRLFILPAEKKGVTLQLNAEENIMAYGDPEMINTVIRNLLNNAVKFSNAGDMVEMDVRSEEGLVKVDVRDQGVGITGENLKKLFNLAGQRASQGTGGEKGTGLGLIICKEFIEKNGGKLIVKSEPGKGSSFSFYLKAGQDVEG